MSRNDGPQDDKFSGPLEVFGDTLAVFADSGGKYQLSLPGCLQKRRVLVGLGKACPELLRAMKTCWTPKMISSFTK